MNSLPKARFLVLVLLCILFAVGSVEAEEVLYESSLSEIGDEWRIDQYGEIVDGGLNFWANSATLMQRYGNVAYEFEVEWKDIAGALPDVNGGFGIHFRKRGPFDSYTSSGYLIVFRPYKHPDKDKDTGNSRFWFVAHAPDGAGGLKSGTGIHGWVDYVFDLSEGTGLLKVKIVTDSEKVVVYLNGEKVKEFTYANLEGTDDAPTFTNGYFALFQQKRETEKLIFRNLRITAID